MSDNNNPPTSDCGDDEKPEPPAPHERSPSVMSHSSAVLEWDPSADVGAASDDRLGGRTTTSDNAEHKSSDDELSTYQRISEFHVKLGPSHEVETPQRPNASGSESSESQKGKPCTNSTPSASPVPLESLLHSPIRPQMYPLQRSKKMTVFPGASGSAAVQAKGVQKGNPEDSSDENKTDDLTEGRRTPGRNNVSEASTDWEYDNDKQRTSKFVPEWQTSGMTRSEIEYQNRKNGGSSTSAASSVFMLQVDSTSRCKGTPDEKSKKSQMADSETRKVPEKSGPGNAHDLERRLYKNISRHHGGRNYFKDFGSSDSDPSTMCMVVDDFVKIMDDHPSKENMKYDILKKHRDYHVVKVQKQIVTLEKLNRALLICKRRPGKAPAHAQTSNRAGDNEPSTDQAAALRRQVLNRDPVNLPNSKFKDEPTNSFRPLEPFRHNLPPENFHSGSHQRRTKEYLSDPTSQFFRPGRQPSQNINLGAMSSYWNSCSVLEELLSEMALEQRRQMNAEIEAKKTTRRRREDFYSSAPHRQREADHDFDDRGRGDRKVRDEVHRGDRCSAKSRNLIDKGVGTDSPLDQPKNVELKRSPIAFYVPMFGTEFDEEDAINENQNEVGQLKYREFCKNRNEKGLYDVAGPIPLQNCLKENYKQCYNNLKEREDILLDMRINRVIMNESILQDILDAKLNREEVEEYLDHCYLAGNDHEKDRLLGYWEMFVQRQQTKLEKFNGNKHLISTKEMRERTERLRKNDPAVLEKKQKEVVERHRKTSRVLQKVFSVNLRKYQRQGNINIPNRMKLGPGQL